MRKRGDWAAMTDYGEDMKGVADAERQMRSREAEACERAWTDGRTAAAEGKTYRDHCPYTFERAGCSLAAFDRAVRPLMDSWFSGWAGWLAERNLGYGFKPLGR